MLIKILDVFANKIVKREKRNAYVYLKEDILLILRNQPVKKEFALVITKSKQTNDYKWQCECEYPSSPDSAMTLMTLTLSSSCFQTDHSWISFELMPGD